MSGHTPGPWEVAHRYTIFPAGNRSLAIAVSEQHRKNEAEANARLIAAAPALLEALEELISSTWLSIDHERNRTPEACARRSKAIAAIDQAKAS